MAFFLYQSNLLESLAERLIVELDVPQAMKSSLFSKEIIIVQSRGMEKWLSMYIATENGISANIGFPFPKGFIYNSLFSSVLDLPNGVNSVNPEMMSWKIMGALPAFIENDHEGVFDDLKSYLRGTATNADDKLKLYQLSSRIASVFDQYMLYRPEMLLNNWKIDSSKTPYDVWNKHRQWQQTLFNKIAEGAEVSMPPQLCDDFISRLNPDANKDFESLTLPGLPSRIFIFGVSVMPPQFIDIFMALSRKIDVHFFYMVPCQEYFADIEPANKAFRKCIINGKSPEDMHFEEANPLLASMGKYGREFQTVVTNKTDGHAEELFRSSNKSDLLSIMQDNILTLGEKEIDAGAKLNIQIHACYNPMREVEVLYDNLLSIIETEKIDPKDILVMTPDIVKYSPFIRAVFDTPENPASSETAKYIPYSLADRTISSESPEFKAFAGILEISKKRYNAAAVVDILDTDGVREKFNLNSDELSVVRSWLADCRVSWGIDAAYRAEIGLPAFDEGSWRAGLKRMLLGFALGTEGNEEGFKSSPLNADQIFPYDKIEENNAIVLGKFIEFTDRIFEFGEQLAGERTLTGWGDFLLSLINTFIASNKGNNQQLTKLIRHVEKLPEIHKTANYEEKLPFSVVKAYLLENFKQDKSVGGFMHCGVTFCEMQPMRSIPFKVICMLGMNDGDFPRLTQRPGFDLMLESPRGCDREQRYEDKYLFLEAMLSARQYLYISYTGINMDNNKDLPPSVIVSDLLDYLTTRLGCAREKVFTRHPLQSFSYRNYLADGDPKIFSYSKNNYMAAKELFAPEEERKSVHVFWPDDQLLPNACDEDQAQVELDSLVRFFKNPAKYFLKNRLNLRLGGDDDAELDEQEIFELDSLQKHHLKQVIVKAIISQNSEGTKEDLKAGGNFYLNMKAQGMLPAEPFAASLYNELFDEATVFADKLKDLTDGYELRAPEMLKLSLESGISLTVNCCNLYINKNNEEKQVIYFFTDEKVKYNIEGWLKHLAVNVFTPIETVILFKDKVIKLHKDTKIKLPADPFKPGEILNGLTAIFKAGWLTHPLPFFPESANAFMDQLAKLVKGKKALLEKTIPLSDRIVPDKWLTTPEDEEASLKEAAKKYEVDPDSDFSFGEASDNYIKYCFTEDFFSAKEYTPQRDEFKDLAKSILGPMLEAKKKGEEEEKAEREKVKAEEKKAEKQKVKALKKRN